MTSASKKLEGYGSLNYKITSATGERFVLKHYLDISELDLVRAENDVLIELGSFRKVALPLPIKTINSEFIHQYEDGSFARLLNFIPGKFLAEADLNDELLFSFGRAIANFNKSLDAIVNHPIAARKQVWDLKLCLLNIDKLKHIKKGTERKLAHYFFDQYRFFVDPLVNELPHQIIHNDLNDWNVLVEDSEVSGFIDFGDIAFAPRINELAIALAYVMMDQEEPLAVAKKIISSYQANNPLTPKEIGLLYYLIPARLATIVSNSAEAKQKSVETEYILISEKPAWDLLKKWISFNPLFVQNEFLSAAGFEKIKKSSSEVEERRKNHFSQAMSLSYDHAIYMHSAAFQYMFDQQGNRYLDAYNNIPLVGHCHPKISEAISQQVRLLNTNTRYHYDALGQYAEQLLSFFPKKLNKVFFVNSGSAASDLAIRLTETSNKKKHHIILENGYHGNTIASIDISSYKFDGHGGLGEKSFITTLPLPKEFNGKFSTTDAYIEHAMKTINELEEKGIAISSFIAEPISGCGGQVPLIDGYLKKLVPFLNERGIHYVSDEVQTGFGRLGKFFWGFEMHEVEPDIVILGKAMGNGHPLAAVVTTEAIAENFHNGMEFFSSFGGNPVSCIVGKTVLDIVEEEGLQANANEVGEYWKASLEQLKSKYSCIGDVRGQGLFLGIEFVHPSNLKADGSLASAVKNQLKNNFVLSGTDGPHNNVVKVKPPLCFNRTNVDEFINKLDLILGK